MLLAACIRAASGRSDASRSLPEVVSSIAQYREGGTAMPQRERHIPPDADRRHELPLWTTILGNVRAFALLPDWLVGAVQPERVYSVLIRSIPEFAAGTLILQDCRAKHLLLSDDGMGWTGTYHLTI